MKRFHENFGVITSDYHKSIPLGIKEGRKFGVDNNSFIRGFNSKLFFSYLEKLKPYIEQCLFIVCPDVLGNPRETLQLWNKWKEKIKEYGPIAFVAQDGMEHYPLPPDFDWMFIGGTDDFKLGIGAKDCIWRTQEMNKPVHVGRVNSIKRFRYFQRLGVNSVDGTSPCYGPDIYRRRYTNAVSQLDFHNDLFSGDSNR